MCTPEHGSVTAEIKAEQIPAEEAPSELDAELASLTDELMGVLVFGDRKEVRAFLLSQDPRLNPEGADALCDVLLDGTNRLIPAYDSARIDGLRAAVITHLERKGIKKEDLTKLDGKLALAKAAINALETRKD